MPESWRLQVEMLGWICSRQIIIDGTVVDYDGLDG